jgi:hypothetical protein
LTAAILLAAVAVCGCEFNLTNEESSAQEETHEIFETNTSPEQTKLTASSTHFSLSSQQLNVYRHIQATAFLQNQYFYLQLGLLADDKGTLTQYTTAGEYVQAALPSTLNLTELDESVCRCVKEILASQKLVGISYDFASDLSSQFADWVFDPTRQKEDTVSIIDGENVIVALYIGESRADRELNAVNKMTPEAIQRTVEEAIAAYAVKAE